MVRHAVIAISMLLLPVSALAATPTWRCKPVWHFSGMGDKTYEGSSSSEAAAKDAARKACILDNRDLELDDFCLPDPDRDEWHCAQSAQQTSGTEPRN